MDTGVGGCVKGRVCKDRDILDGEEFQNVEKLGHTYERKRTEKVGQFVLPYSRDGLTATFLTRIWPPQRGCLCSTSEVTQPEVVCEERRRKWAQRGVLAVCGVCTWCVYACTRAHTRTYTCSHIHMPTITHSCTHIKTHTHNIGISD